MQLPLVKRYFYIQNITFAALGIDPQASQNELIIKRPLLCYGIMLCSICHSLAAIHYVYVHINDYIAVTDCMSLLLQSLLATWKMTIFLRKRNEIVKFIREIRLLNEKANYNELSIIRSENEKADSISTIYFNLVLTTASTGLVRVILYAIYVYFREGVLDLQPPHAATYPWNYSTINGYLIVYIWCVLIEYFVCFASLAIDSLFAWLICNVIAQFRIVVHHLHTTAAIMTGRSATSAAYVIDKNACNDDRNDGDGDSEKQKLQRIIACIRYHRKTLKLPAKLNRLYGEIIFIKFIISCSEICCLAFRLSRSNGSIGVIAYQFLFLIAIAIQLILYCYNGQRLKDESMQVASEIYTAFEWSHLAKSCKKLLLLPMMRSQKSSHLKGVFFIVDLGLYLWVFKTAGSLIAALKTLEENQ